MTDSARYAWNSIRAPLYQHEPCQFEGAGFQAMLRAGTVAECNGLAFCEAISVSTCLAAR